MRLYIIRHADPDYPNNTITALGHREAGALAEHFSRKAGFTHLYNSPLGRAVDTMGYTAKVTGLSSETLPWTAELAELLIPDAPPDCRMAWDMPGEKLRGRVPADSTDAWLTRTDFAGKHYREAWERIRAGSDALLARHGYRREGHAYRIERSTKDRIAVFCHGGLGLTWLAHLLDVPVPLLWSGFWMTPTGVTTVLMDERDTTWAVPRAIHVNATNHLTAAGIDPNPHGIKANFD